MPDLPATTLAIYAGALVLTAACAVLAAYLFSALRKGKRRSINWLLAALVLVAFAALTLVNVADFGGCGMSDELILWLLAALNFMVMIVVVVHLVISARRHDSEGVRRMSYCVAINAILAVSLIHQAIGAGQ